MCWRRNRRKKYSPLISPHAKTFYSAPDSSPNNRSSEHGPVRQILESESWTNGHFVSVLINSWVETLEHDRLSHAFVGLGRYIGFLNTGSGEFHGLNLSELEVLCQIDDLDGVWPNKAGTGDHLGANGAVPGNRGLPNPFVL